MSAVPNTVVSILSYLEGSNSVSPVFTTNSAALVAPGTGIFADRIGRFLNITASGLYVFDTEECAGLDLQFILTGAAATSTAIARILTATPFRKSAGARQTAVATEHWTCRQICDLTLTASNQTGVAGGIIDTASRWATIAVTGGTDSGLGGTKVMAGFPAGSASRVIIDPVCHPRVLVQLSISGTTTAASVVAGKWTGN